VKLKLNWGLVIALSQAGKADCNQKPLHGHRRARDSHHSGDTWYSMLEIVDLSKERPNGLVTTKVTMFNQRIQFVALKEHKYLLKTA
jgi:hypothetical protein